jgi:HD-GYP domain-containing protein (c-di-GMP phosphodiesterase class II)
VGARIVAVADVFDVLIHERPYKKAWSVQDALTEINTQAGAQFDPEIVRAFAACCSPNIAENLGVDLERLLGAVEPRRATADPRDVRATVRP